MKKKNQMMIVLAAVVLLGGCAAKNEDLLTGADGESLFLQSDAAAGGFALSEDAGADGSASTEDAGAGGSASTEDAGTDGLALSEDAGTDGSSSSAGAASQSGGGSGDSSAQAADAGGGSVSAGTPGGAKIYVYVCGCVVNPAVYELAPTARIYEAVEMAGGFSAEADENALNLAEGLTDGQKVYVPSKEEQAAAAETASAATDAASSADADGGLVNLNTATKEQLMTLSGIGESKADSILSYREEHGGFSAVEEIMDIEGIKEGIFNKIKDDITV